MNVKASICFCRDVSFKIEPGTTTALVGRCCLFVLRKWQTNKTFQLWEWKDHGGKAAAENVWCEKGKGDVWRRGREKLQPVKSAAGDGSRATRYRALQRHNQVSETLSSREWSIVAQVQHQIWEHGCNRRRGGRGGNSCRHSRHYSGIPR